MAYQAGTATSQEDFMSKLMTFAVANGWTQDDFDAVNDRMSLHRAGVFVTFRWDNNQGIAVYQHLSYAAGTPQAQPGGSGNSAQVSPSNITSGRCMNVILNGPYVSHHFFADTTPAPYIYAALEYSPGLWSFCGFGELEKFGNWTGGEWASGHFWSTGTDTDSPGNGTSCVLLDGGNTGQTLNASLHIEGMPTMIAAQKWGIITGNQSSGVAGMGQDLSGNNRVPIMGGMRSGPYTQAYGNYSTSQQQGFVPLIPVPAFYRDIGFTPMRMRFLGYFPGVRAINIAAFEPTTEIVLGPDTWKVFPHRRRQQVVSNDTPQSGWGGFAFKKT
jgi:hypothetical protein